MKKNITKWGKMSQGNLSHIEGEMSQERSVVSVACHLGRQPVAGQDVVGHGARCHRRGKMLQGKLSRGNLMSNPHLSIYYHEIKDFLNRITTKNPF